jgi:hypothetical protein
LNALLRVKLCVPFRCNCGMSTVPRSVTKGLFLEVDYYISHNRTEQITIVTISYLMSLDLEHDVANVKDERTGNWGKAKP